MSNELGGDELGMSDDVRIGDNGEPHLLAIGDYRERDGYVAYGRIDAHDALDEMIAERGVGQRGGIAAGAERGAHERVLVEHASRERVRDTRGQEAEEQLGVEVDEQVSGRVLERAHGVLGRPEARHDALDVDGHAHRGERRVLAQVRRILVRGQIDGHEAVHGARVVDAALLHVVAHDAGHDGQQELVVLGVGDELEPVACQYVERLGPGDGASELACCCRSAFLTSCRCRSYRDATYHEK